MDKAQIDKIATNPEDRVLLARIWDKVQSGIRRNIPINTCFLSLREQELARYLLGKQDGLFFFGGYEDAERKMLVYLPDYLPETSLYEDPPLICLRALFYQQDHPTHRDFLGALIGAGIAREAIGDICVSSGSCDFLVTAEVAPMLLQEFDSAGRTKLRISQIPLSDISVPQPETLQIRDTLASLRLDNVISAGFRVSRAVALQYISAGRVAINGLPCEKPDKPLEQDSVISVRGFGKIRLSEIGGQSKKGRIFVVIDRYI